ncbi:hypothetical protein PICMEDRAFT_15991 [Pichia membranifaciens NRRL Y-2026]|uniref:C2H2-type domain-containing protein n=1 Tax=Pichia membranifaciens NRRL Y-2026 TaxID=763406 RepID=A0A1E3NQ32_9ASCO|nr:hypothetical protein PICMEDRAFT_15991 [Pichia membranifaciens NRRL Y-2026]ODQ48175.1 hypothetical protein PICMEDRAFT_15991 [Pichia membranifaciens NRRL Y-2026]
MAPLFDTQFQSTSQSTQGQDQFDWVGPASVGANANTKANAAAPALEKPALNLSNSLSSIFFNNIYNDAETAGVAQQDIPETRQDDAGADISSTLLQLINEKPLVTDMKSTPRCATRLNFDVNPLLFTQPVTGIPPADVSPQFKDPQSISQSGVNNDNNSITNNSNNTDEQYNSLFTYLMNANQDVSTPANDYYSIHTPVASDMSLSPYQRRRLESGVSGSSANGGSDDFLMMQGDLLSDATSVTYLDEHSLSKFNDFSNMGMNPNTNTLGGVDTGSDRFNTDNNTMARDRLFSSFSEVETLNEEMKEALNEARLQLPISLPSQGMSLYSEKGDGQGVAEGSSRRRSDVTSAHTGGLNNYQDMDSNDESNEFGTGDSESDGENNGDDDDNGDNNDSDDDTNISGNCSDDDSFEGTGEVKRGAMAVKRARNHARGKSAGSGSTAFAGGLANGIGKTDKQFKCSKCTSSFTRKTRLTEHVNRVHLGKIYHFKCNQCGTRLSSKENLTRHSIVHTDKFKCKRCNRRFDRSYRFQRHLEKCNMAHY